MQFTKLQTETTSKEFQVDQIAHVSKFDFVNNKVSCNDRRALHAERAWASNSRP